LSGTSENVILGVRDILIPSFTEFIKFEALTKYIFINTSMIKTGTLFSLVSKEISWCALLPDLLLQA